MTTPILASPLRILYWDIETAQNLVALFQLGHNDWVDPSAIVQERYIICASWQWEGEQTVHSTSVLDNPARYEQDPYDDRHVVETLYGVLAQADMIVHHNGDNFDKRYLDTRILVHGLPALPPITSIDTYKIAKQRLYFNSNKLTYIGQLLGVGEKLPTTPGLWMRILKGDASAITEMVAYNKRDVTLLRDVYLKLRPFMASHVNRELYGQEGCPKCGSKKFQSRGYHRAISRVYQRFCCKSCGGWFRSVLNEKDIPTKYRSL